MSEQMHACEGLIAPPWALSYDSKIKEITEKISPITHRRQGTGSLKRMTGSQGHSAS